MNNGKKRAAFPLAASGTALLLVTALLVFMPFLRGAQVSSQLEKTAEALDSMLSGHGIKGGADNLPAMPILIYENTDYIALLTFDRAGVCLPVREVRDGDDRTAGPFREEGSVYENTLVIGGMDLRGQFCFFDEADIGDTVRLTDMRGGESVYEICKVKRSGKADWASYREQGADLILYSFTPYRKKYCVVMCKKKTGK